MIMGWRVLSLGNVCVARTDANGRASPRAIPLAIRPRIAYVRGLAFAPAGG